MPFSDIGQSDCVHGPLIVDFILLIMEEVQERGGVKIKKKKSQSL